MGGRDETWAEAQGGLRGVSVPVCDKRGKRLGVGRGKRKKKMKGEKELSGWGKKNVFGDRAKLQERSAWSSRSGWHRFQGGTATFKKKIKKRNRGGVLISVGGREGTFA